MKVSADTCKKTVNLGYVLEHLACCESVERAMGKHAIRRHVASLNRVLAAESDLAKARRRLDAVDLSTRGLQVVEEVAVATSDLDHLLACQAEARDELGCLALLVRLHLRRMGGGHHVIVVVGVIQHGQKLHEAAASAGVYSEADLGVAGEVLLGKQILDVTRCARNRESDVEFTVSTQAARGVLHVGLLA